MGEIILIGDRRTYYFLSQHDQDFSKLFKVPVDFDEEILRNQKNIVLYVWYDNEYGYTRQVIRFAKYIAEVRRLVYY